MEIKKDLPSLRQLLGRTDVYLLDQIMKGRYEPPGPILDAGAGGGRNLHWFAHCGFQVFGIDRNPEAVATLQETYPEQPAENFRTALLEELPFPSASFQHIICCAVLHFAESPEHFRKMFEEMIRVLKPGGSLFIRVATDVGLKEKMILLGNGRFHMPDGSDRYLATRGELESLVKIHKLIWAEPFKTVLVDELRSMGVLVFEKNK